MEEKLKMVKNEKKYHEFIRQMRNHKKNKGGFIQQRNISRKEQEKYMGKYGDNYYICLLGEKPVGYIGVINSDIRVATDPDFHGKGIGLFMVKFVKNKFKKAQAKVKIDNIASIKLFEKAGFKLKYYIYEP